MHGLEDLNVLDNTVVFFTSDNGYHLGEHKMPFGKGNVDSSPPPPPNPPFLFLKKGW